MLVPEGRGAAETLPDLSGSFVNFLGQPGKSPPGRGVEGQRSFSCYNTEAEVSFILTGKDRRRRKANLLRVPPSTFHPDWGLFLFD